MSQPNITRIANRHVARCMTKIEEVHELPEICKEAIRSEMHYCAEDVVTALGGEAQINDEDDNRGNR